MLQKVKACCLCALAILTLTDLLEIAYAWSVPRAENHFAKNVWLIWVRECIDTLRPGLMASKHYPSRLWLILVKSLILSQASNIYVLHSIPRFIFFSSSPFWVLQRPKQLEL